MKKKILIATIASIITLQANADYMIKYQIEPTPNSIIIKGWFDTTASISDWLNTGNAFDCGDFSPLENTITINQSFEQSRNCSINQERTVQNRKISENGTYKNEGVPIVETRLIGALETWELTTANYTGWVNSGTYYDCTNWTPLADTIEKDIPFEQTASDCKLNQTQNRQDREIETTTGVIRNKGTVVVENKILTNKTNTKNAIGTKVNKVCLYDRSHQPTAFYWMVNGSIQNFWIQGHDVIPFLWADAHTGIEPDLGSYFGPAKPIPNLSRISSSELRYTTPNKVFKITRGERIIKENPHVFYKVCIE